MHKREVETLGQRKKAIYFILALILLFNYALVFADNSLEDLKNKKKDALQQLDETKKEKKILRSKPKTLVFKSKNWTSKWSGQPLS